MLLRKWRCPSPLSPSSLPSPQRHFRRPSYLRETSSAIDLAFPHNSKPKSPAMQAETHRWTPALHSHPFWMRTRPVASCSSPFAPPHASLLYGQEHAQNKSAHKTTKKRDKVRNTISPKRRGITQIWLQVRDESRNFQECYFLLATYCWTLLSKYGDFRICFLKIWRLWRIFFTKILCMCPTVNWIFLFCRQVAKICQNTQLLW